MGNTAGRVVADTAIEGVEVVDTLKCIDFQRQAINLGCADLAKGTCGNEESKGILNDLERRASPWLCGWRVKRGYRNACTPGSRHLFVGPRYCPTTGGARRQRTRRVARRQRRRATPKRS